MTETFQISRAELAKVFDSARAIAQFEDMQRKVAETSETVGANVDATTALKDASFLTLSPNADLTNEYVLQYGEGVRIVAEGGVAKLYIDAAIAVSGHSIRLTTTGDTRLALPITGFVATREGTETLKAKTLDAPKLSGLANAANDAAAATASVPIGGIYHNAGELRVRLT